MAYQKDRRDLTRYRKGQQDPRRTDAQIGGDVTVTGTNADARAGLLDAIDQALTAKGTHTHPDNTNLPVQRASATYLSPTEATVELDYFKDASAVPRRQATDLAETVLSLQQFPWKSRPVTDAGTAVAGSPSFDACGNPTGALDFNVTHLDNSLRVFWRSFTRTVAVENIYIPTILSDDPRTITAITDIQGYINNGTVTLGGTYTSSGFGGKVFGTATLLFAGMRVKPVDTSEGVKYVTRYHMIHNKCEWRKQFHLAVTVGTATPVVISPLIYPLAAFTASGTSADDIVLRYHDPVTE